MSYGSTSARIQDLVASVGGAPVPRLSHRCRAEPAHLAGALATALPGRCVVTGTIERRLVFAESRGHPEWTIADLSGDPHRTRSWPAWTAGRITVHEPDEWISPVTLEGDALHRLTRPRLLLAALYHPENFPLPRFPLAISDLARAARSTLLGQVDLMDMQLGWTLDDVLDRVRTTEPDIVGISATFGQYDIMIDLLDNMFDLADPPLVLAGGSLTARNERLLLDRYPRLIVARGAGEPTVADILAHWHDDLDLNHVRGIGYVGAMPRDGAVLRIGTFRRTATVANRLQTDIFPELDLLQRTFTRKGVAQLESSRGCTNYCSFCPRGHKGVWAGTPAESLPWILAEIGAVMDRNPGISRTLYLVDEEFIGRDAGAADRALAVAGMLHQHRLKWETSCRVDQIVDPRQGSDWHVARAAMWRDLLALGLRRCLFGVESGVTSILERFNKETTAEQNALAIRTLSALGVPTRFTYITFDHLMTMDELRETYAFQGRHDLLLNPLPELSVREIVDGVRDESFVAEHKSGRPFYSGISYMLVSMECLIGAAYTRQVELAGLTGTVRPSMGRVDADFADWRIGACSQRAQLWVDRNFALDYTLKSLEKILDGAAWKSVHRTRLFLKESAYTVLGTMLELAQSYSPCHPATAALSEALTGVMDAQNACLTERLAGAVAAQSADLPGAARTLLAREFDRWMNTREWRLINADGPC